MTKQELIEKAVAHYMENANTSIYNARREVMAVLDALEALLPETLAAGEAVTLPGLGKLVPVKRAARTGRNPRTGAPVEIPARTAVRFKASKTLKDAVNA